MINITIGIKYATLEVKNQQEYGLRLRLTSGMKREEWVAPIHKATVAHGLVGEENSGEVASEHHP
jgi:hypothetical protein